MKKILTLLVVGYIILVGSSFIAYAQLPYGSYCTDNIDCYSGRCIIGTCACIQNSDCSNNLYCDYDTGQCISIGPTGQHNKAYGDSCIGNSDCISDYCDINVCGCRQNSHCPSGQTCDIYGYCVGGGTGGTQCSYDGDCPGGQICTQGYCAGGGTSGGTSGGTAVIPNPLKCDDIQCLVQTIADFITGLVVVIGGIMIIISGIQFITSAGNEEKARRARQTIIYTLIGIAIAVSVDFIVGFLGEILGKR